MEFLRADLSKTASRSFRASKQVRSIHQRCGKGHHKGPIFKAPCLAVGNGHGAVAVRKEALQTLHQRWPQRNVAVAIPHYVARNMRNVVLVFPPMGQLALPPLPAAVLRGKERTWRPCALQSLQQRRKVCISSHISISVHIFLSLSLSLYFCLSLSIPELAATPELAIIY